MEIIDTYTIFKYSQVAIRKVDHRISSKFSCFAGLWKILASQISVRTEWLSRSKLTSFLVIIYAHGACAPCPLLAQYSSPHPNRTSKCEPCSGSTRSPEVPLVTEFPPCHHHPSLHDVTGKELWGGGGSRKRNSPLSPNSRSIVEQSCCHRAG